MVEDQKDKSQIIANSFFKALDFTGGPEKAVNSNSSKTGKVKKDLISSFPGV